MAKYQDRIKALQPVRAATHGWAFTTADRLPTMLEAAEAALANVPPQFYADANIHVQALRAAVKDKRNG